MSFPRPKTVAGRVALVLVGVQVATSLLAVGLAAVLASGGNRQLAARSMEQQLDAVAREIEERAAPLYTLDALPPLLLSDLETRFLDPIYLVDANVDAIRSVGEAPSVHLDDATRAALTEAMATSDVFVQVDPRNTVGAAPLFDADGLLVGSLLVLPMEETLAQTLAPQRQAYARALALSGVVALGLALVLGLVYTQRLIAPLRTITSGIERVGSGDYSGRLPATRTPDDEIGRLTTAVNRMAEQVAGSFDRLQTADRLRRDLITNVGHDLRTPLAALSGYAEEAERLMREGRPDESAQALASVRRQSGALARLIDDLFELSILESAPAPLRREPVPLAELLHDAADRHRALMASDGLDFALDLPPALPTLDADGLRLLRLIDNLLANARRHTAEGGRVTLSADWQPDHVALHVADTGSGIAPDLLPTLFERYHRGDGPRTRGTSTGLGLAIARQIAQAHGGTLTAQSTFGQGSRFTLLLPTDPLQTDAAFPEHVGEGGIGEPDDRIS